MSTSPLVRVALLGPLLLCPACPPGDGEPDGGARPPQYDSSIVDVEGLSPPLVCPGSTGCEEATGDLLAGAARRVITPHFEPWDDVDGDGKRDVGEPFEDLDNDGEHAQVWMAGFDMGRAATGVHDDTWARALVLEKGDVRVGMVVLDVIGFFYPDVVRVRRAAKEAGLDLDHVLVTSTHQHEGKDTMGIWGADPSTTGYDELYMQFVVEQCVAALTAADEAKVRVSVKAAQAPAPHLVADSREPEVIDPVITGIQLLDDDDSPVAHVVVWGNHPESLGGSNTLLTSDYPHYLREYLEATWPGSVALFLVGTLGGLMNPLGRVVGCPDEDGEPTCPVGDFARAAYIGEGVAQIIIDALAGAGEAAPVTMDPAAASLAVRRLPKILAPTNTVFLLAFKLGLLTRDAYTLDDGTLVGAERIRELPIEDFLADLGIGTEVSSLRLGPVELVAVPGELYPELWLVKDDGSSYIEHPEGADFPGAEAETPIMASMPDAPLQAILNNAGDALGYIIPKPQFDYEAPYAYDPEGQYGEQNSLGEHTAPEVTSAISELYALEP